MRPTAVCLSVCEEQLHSQNSFKDTLTEHTMLDHPRRDGAAGKGTGIALNLDSTRSAVGNEQTLFVC